MNLPKITNRSHLLLMALCASGYAGSGYCASSDTVSIVELQKCRDAGDNDASLKCYQLLTKASEKATTVLADRSKSASIEGWDTQYSRGKILDNMEFSYFTAGTGARIGADQTTANMLYEAQIFKNISWYEWKLGQSKIWLDIPVKITVRQLTENSKPVRTPSYVPGVRLYMSSDAILNEKNYLTYYSLGFHHYSNGQEGTPETREGLANTRSGSFNSNYVEAAGHIFQKDADWVETGRLAFRQHLYGTWESFQLERYPKRHVSLELRTPEFFRDRPTQFRLTETVSWGNRYAVKNDVIPALNAEARIRDRFHTTFEVLSRVSPRSSLAWYVRYDLGRDYYNINFQNRMNRFQIGVAAR